MAPRKQKHQDRPQATVAPDAPPQPAPLPGPEATTEDDLKEYSEGQQNEYFATQAIYPDEFVRIGGRKDAWKVSTGFVGLR